MAAAYVRADSAQAVFTLYTETTRILPNTASAHPSFDANSNSGPPNSLNLVDLLAQSPQHSILLRLLQRTRLIPTLNRLQEFDDGSGITLLAPINEAFLHKRDQEALDMSLSLHNDEFKPPTSFWSYLIDSTEASVDAPKIPAFVWHQGRFITADNVNAVARQHLLYHLLNYTLPFTLSRDTGVHSPRAPLPEPGKPQLHVTMHFPSRRLLTEPTKPGHIPPPDQEDHGGLLGDQGQRLRVALETIEDDLDNEAVSPVSGTAAASASGEGARKRHRQYITFGANVSGQGGSRSLYENWNSRKGVIHSIDSVLDLPPSLEHVVDAHPRLEGLRHLLDTTTIRSLSTVPHLTLFLPASEAFSKLSALEQAYLFGASVQASQDRLKLLGWHATGLGLGDGKPVYAAAIRNTAPTRLTTTLGGSVELLTDSNTGAISVLGAEVIEEDVLVENGVIHIVDNLVLPFGDLDMSIEKTLLALNASKFVDLVYEAGLQHYINAPAHQRLTKGREPFTFLAPRDDVIDSWLAVTPASFATQSESRSLNHLKQPAGPSLEEVVKYHILPGLIRPSNLTDGLLLGTELRDWRLREGRQRMPVQVDDEKTNSDRKGNGDVGFGDANVLRDPVELDDSAVIYIVSQLLQPPADPIQTAVSYLQLSTFVATVFSADLKGAVQRAPGVTYLVPTNDAFSGLGLAMSYLLLPESQHLLQSLVEFHAIDKIAYLSDFSSDEVELPTLLPDVTAKLLIKRQRNGSVTVRRSDRANDTRSTVIKGDILTNTGVIHEVDKIQTPFDITVRDLLRGAKADTMEDLMTQAGYDFILNSTISNSTEFPSFVVLVPTDSAFTRINLTAILDDRDLLMKLVQQHIIPLTADHDLDAVLPDGRKDKLQLSDESSFATLLDRSTGGPSRFGSISFRKVDNVSPNLRSRADFASSSELDDLGWIVGIKDTRGTTGQHHSARLLAFGRETRGIHANEVKLRPEIGGVFQIDSVLSPYEPGWLYQWGWVVITSFFLALLLASLTLLAFRWWNRDGRIRLPEALEGKH
ncbi:FAS1 domain-containing protein [Testicularia cyperi]|uniref:FAS1 domain-containing protein n=1 Tax=Testicularia cyperi TaxID=1882483 RepID=A0A317XZI4_9BASI|nr:FAS1 domain-containing protein [Testicularia cyperi]